MRLLLVAAALLVLAVPTHGQDGPPPAEHRAHPPADMPLHEQFYSTWFMPDEPDKSCCSKGAGNYPPARHRIPGDIMSECPGGYDAGCTNKPR